jgi:predicted ArsR family transcriptional regulator
MVDVDRQEPDGDRLAALGEPLRRGIFLYVASAAAAVSRDQTAEHFGVSRAVAAFHLDKLADVGLLEVEFKRPPGRGGPGAGRPAKLYRAGAREVSFSFPPREYELAGRLLAEAVHVSARERVPVERALEAAARTVGHSLGRRAQEEADGAGEGEAIVGAACDVLRSCAYAPRDDGEELVLLNCPFHALAESYRDVVCGMNLALMTGFAEELVGAELEARLDPRPGECCVRLVRRPRPAHRPPRK